MKTFACAVILLIFSALARAQYSPATGTIFSESPGNIATNPLPCWSGATGSAADCQQTGAVVSGSTYSVTTCPSGFTATNCLELPANATANEIDYYGTIPLVAQASGSCTTISVEFEYSSTTHTAYRDFVDLVDGSGNKASEWSWNTSGDAHAYLNTSGTVAVSASAHHTLVSVLCGASSYSMVDGGSHNTFTAPSHNYFKLRLQGDTTGNTLYFGNITITSQSPTQTGGWPLSAFMDNNGQTNGGTVSLSTLLAGTRGVATQAWSASATQDVTFAYDNTYNCTFPSGVNVGGGSYTGSGLMIKATFPVSEVGGSFYLQQPTPISQASASVCWGTDAVSTNLTFVDQFGMVNGPAFHICGGASATATSCTCSSGCGFLLACGEQLNGQTVGCAQIQDLPQLYIVTTEITGTGTDYMDFYTFPGLSHLSGNSSGLGCAFSGHTLCMTDSGTQYAGAQFGALGSESNAVLFHSWYGNLMMNWMNLNGNAVDYPLLPPASSGHCAACDVSKVTSILNWKISYPLLDPLSNSGSSLPWSFGYSIEE